MSLKVTLYFCLTVLAQVTISQFIGNPLNPGFPSQLPGNFNPFGQNFGGQIAPGSPTSGGGFAVTSSSPIAPTGVSVLAENLAIEGGLSVGGQLPFLGTVGLEGSLPAYGSGAVSYGCGNGNLGITSEGLGPGGPTPYGMAGQNFGPSAPGQFGPNAPGPFGALSNQAFGPGFNPGLGPSGPAFGPGIGPGIGFNNPL